MLMSPAFAEACRPLLLGQHRVPVSDHNLLTQCSILRSMRRILNGVHMPSVVNVHRTGIAIAIAAAIVLVIGLFTGLIAGVAERALIRTRSG
jgi:predicted Abi (CAAX) family protease